MDFTLFKEYGFAGIVTGVMFFILFRMIVWVMAFVKDIIKQHNEERKEWLLTMAAIKTSIDLHNQQSIEARNLQAQAHEFQRKEHEKFLENQIKIISISDKTCDCLDEVKNGLGRINGYTPH
ncbi:MAG: hypothetical protein PHH69_03750 [Candidatus Omnitrophica bacterium]|nr:hypothetical protein [Candidatus Omnitrophota bacterium]